MTRLRSIPLVPLPSSRHLLAPGRLPSLVYALFFVSGVAQSAIVPLLPRLASRFGLSPSEVAGLLALPGLATLAVSVPAGMAADRFGARRVTLASGALLCLSCLGQATASLPLLLTGRVVFGVSFGIVWTTGMAWLSEVGSVTRGGALGPSVTWSSVGLMIGPAVGGILAQWTGLGVPFELIGGAAALVTVALALGSASSRIPRRRTPDALAPRPTGLAPRPDGPAPHPSLGSLTGLLRRPGVGAAAGGLIVSGGVSGASQLLITIGLHQHGLSSGRIGLAFSAAAVGYIAVSAAVVRLGERVRTLRFNALATLALALALAPALTGGGAPALVIALLATALARAAISTVAYSLASEPASDRAGGEGLVFGMLNGAWAAAMVLTPLLAGLVDQQEGARSGYLAVIVPSCAIAGWLIARSRPVRTHPAALRAG